MARRSFVLVIMGTVIWFLCSAASADVPHMINYQGKLTTAGGGCLNGTVQMTFSIYPDTLGSPADWSETQTVVLVKEGIFSVLLGSVDTIPAAVFDGTVKYLGVQVESDPEMTPLKPMVSVAYAYRAAVAEGAGDITAVHADNGLGGGGTSGEIHLSVGAGDGIEVWSDAVSVDVTAFSGSGLKKEGINDLAVNAGLGLVIENDSVRLASAYSSGSAYDSRFVNEGQDDSIDSSMIQDGSVQFAHIGQNGADTGQIVKWNGNSWVAAEDKGKPGFLPRPAWDSGWLPLSVGGTQILTHGLGGNPDDYFVDFQFKDVNNGYERNINSYGLRGSTLGAYYSNLSSSIIVVTRATADVYADYVRVRIWIVESE